MIVEHEFQIAQRDCVSADGESIGTGSAFFEKTCSGGDCFDSDMMCNASNLAGTGAEGITAWDIKVFETAQFIGPEMT
jgi:hypothetical protein